MKKEKENRIKLMIPAVLVVLIVIILVQSSSNDIVLNAVPTSQETTYELSYSKYLTENGYDGTMVSGTAEVELKDYTTTGELIAENGVDGILTEGSGAITWKVNVPESGFYNLKLSYISLPGTTSDIQRKIYIDDEILYDDLSQIVIKRWWSDEAITKKNRNEIQPDSYEVYQNTDWFVEDANLRYGEPLKFYLAEGTHTITLETVKEPLEITGIRFEVYEGASTYEKVIDTLTSQYTVYDGSNLTFQAERCEDGVESIIKSSSSINVQKNYSDSNLEPYHAYHTVYNTIGKDSWENSGDSITWTINVEEEGLYELTFKGRQSTNRGVTSYRRLYINGEVPYEEMNAIAFEYKSSMNHYTVADEDGEPYLFYLKSGSNTITLEVVMGAFGSIVSTVEESMTNLNNAYLKVIQLVGQSPSKFIDYQIDKKLPEFAVIMQEESVRLNEVVDQIVQITGDKGENTALLSKMAYQAEKLAAKPEGVIKELGQLKNNISAVGTWLVSVSQMPLELDSFTLSRPNATLQPATDGLMASATNGTLRFLSTFFISTNEVSSEKESSGDSLKVWVVSYGKEQAQIIQNLADNSFIADTGIPVNIQLIPEDVVLKAALAGTGPDVVLGLKQTTTQDFAMRDATLDLTQLEGYPEIASQYNQSTLDAASFQDGVYGLAEQSNFLMMFYRKDILNELGVEVPKTWDEFINLIPILQQNNYNAFVPNAYLNDGSGNLNFYLSLVYQNGGDVYDGTGTEYGIRSGLSTVEAMDAFKSYTNLYSNYGLEVQIDFANRFRTGEVPIGIANYTLFNTLEVFAPEIKGLWSFTSVPGTLREDGTIDNTVIADTVQSVIMSSTDLPEEAWEFLKWWVSADTQLQFATTTESVMGTAARYASAIPEVLEQLPWSYQELDVLLNQFEHSVGIPAVPGYYMTNRMISYSFSDVINNKTNPREALYLNIKSIQQELTNKREQLGLIAVKESGGQYEESN